jgi:hypothetical protein
VKRPLGVSFIALLVAASGVLIVYRALTSPGSNMGQRHQLISAGLALLALIAAEALWSLRSHAFLMFTLWALGLMAGIVTFRMHSSASGSPIQLMEPILYGGVAFAITALSLRRTV